MPRVTVIIPTYNWSQALAYAIRSVLRQTFTDFELLVIGDGCTDDSGDVVASFADPRVRWINLPENFGHQSGPNNRGLKEAKGEITAYLGHDDLWLPEHLSHLVKALDGGADVAYGIVEMIDRPGAAPTPAPLELGPYQPRMWIPPTGVAHRTELAIRAGGWPHFVDVPYEPEAVFWERLRSAGGNVAFVPALISIKFPARFRKDAYKLRHCDEQAAFTSRLESEPDFERSEMIRMLAGLINPPRESLPFTRVLTDFLRDLRLRLRRRIFGKPRIRHLNRRQVFNERRLYKGLPAIESSSPKVQS